MTSAFAEAPEISVSTVARVSSPVLVRPAPRREPPFDDELAGRDTTLRDYDRPLPFARPGRHLALHPGTPTPLRSALPDPSVWSRRLLIGVIEAAGGRRPLAQLAPLLSPSVARGLRNELDRAKMSGRPHWTHAAGVRSVRGCEPADDVAELCATMRSGERVRAVAMRLEVRHGRWLCTRLMFG